MTPAHLRPYQPSVRRDFVDDFLAIQVQEIAAGSLVLDLGGVKIHKRGAFDLTTYPLRSVTANLSLAKGADVQADAAILPFQSFCFDVVLCSELLEHVLNPVQVLSETYRVLTPGGTLLITAPFLYRLHADPHDYGRYTASWWGVQLASSGFREIQITPQGYYYSVLVDIFKQYIEARWRGPFVRFGRWAAGYLQTWAGRQDSRLAFRQDPFVSSFTTGYGIRAVK